MNSNDPGYSKQPNYVSEESKPLDEEKFEPIQKAFYLKLNLIIAPLVIIFNIALAVLAFIDYANTDLVPFLILGIAISLAIIIAGASIPYSLAARKAILSGYTPEKKTLRLGEIIFIAAVTIAVLWGIDLPVCFKWSLESKYLGTEWEDSKKYLWVYITVGSVALFMFCYVIFVTWTVSVRRVNIRVLGGICLVGIGLFALLTIWFADNAIEYENQRIVSKVGLGPLKSAYFFSIVILLLVLGAFVGFLTRLRIYFMIVGGIFLFMAAFFVIHSGMVFRKAHEVREGYGNNCHKILSWTHMDEFTYQGCDKYLAGDCDASKQGLKWEQDLGVETSKKKNDLACLNFDCCQKMTGNACKFIYRAAASIWGIAAFSFALSACCLFLTQRETKDKKKSNRPIYFVITGIILVACCVVAIIVVETTRHKPNSEEPLVAAEVTSVFPFKASTSKNNFIPGLNGCKTIYDQLQPAHQNTLVCPDCKGIRIALIVRSGGRIFVNKNFNSNDIFIFSEKYRKEVFPSEPSYSKRTFLMIEGKPNVVSDFLKKQAYFCGLKDNSYSFVNYQTPNARTLQQVPDCELSGHSYNKGCSKKEHNKLEIEDQTLKLISMPTEDQQKQLTSKYSWKTVKVQVFNAKTANPETDVEVYLIPGIAVCNEEALNSLEAIKDISDKEGNAVLNNVIVKDHTLIVRKEGFKANCKTVTVSATVDNVITIPIVENALIERIGILLESGKEANIQLASTFNFDANTMCNSAFFQHNCGHMFYHPKVLNKDRFYQVSTLKTLGVYNYLFYWTSIDGKAKAIENLKKVKIYRYTVFLGEFEFPIDFNEDMPTVVTGMENDNFPTYLAFCINGGGGTSTFSKINQYWIRVALNQNIYQKSMKDERELPTSDICINHYKQLANK